MAQPLMQLPTPPSTVLPDPLPQQLPDPQPQQLPDPQPQQLPDPQPQQLPDPQPQQLPDPQPQQLPDPQPQQLPDPQPQQLPDPQPQQLPDPQPQQLPDPQPQQLPDPQPQQLPDPQPQQLPDPHPQQLPDPAPAQIPFYGLSIQGVREREIGIVAPGEDIPVHDVVDNLKRVENLLWIKGNTCYNEALNDWEQQKKSLGGKLERREKRVEELTNQVYNVIGFFSVFQGVILTAVTQLNSQAKTERPLCAKAVYPLILSLLAMIAAIIGVSLKFRDLRSTDKSIQTFKLRLREAERRESQLQTEGERFLFKSLKDRSPSPRKSYKWILKANLITGGLIVFTVVFCVSYFAILCDKLLP